MSSVWKKRSYSALIVILGVVALIAAAALFVRWSQTKQDAAVNQYRGRATGMSAIRQRLVSDQLPNECLALIREGKRDGALVVRAVDSCHHRALGEWKVDKSNVVTRVR